MAFTLDTALGTGANAGATNATLTTTAAVASGGTIFWFVFKFRAGGPGTVTPSGGGLTWATIHTSTSGNLGVWIFGAFAPAGLASSTVLTGTSSGGTGDYTHGAVSFLGVDQAGTVAAAIRAVNATSAGTAAWSSGTLTGALVGDLVIGAAGGDGTLRTSVIAGDNVEGIDFNNVGTSGSIALNYDLNGESNDTGAGTWSGTLTHLGIGAAMKPAAGVAAVIPDITMAPMSH